MHFKAVSLDFLATDIAFNTRIIVAIVTFDFGAVNALNMFRNIRPSHVPVT